MTKIVIASENLLLSLRDALVFSSYDLAASSNRSTVRHGIVSKAVGLALVKVTRLSPQVTHTFPNLRLTSEPLEEIRPGFPVGMLAYFRHWRLRV